MDCYLAATLKSLCRSILVIGYGNLLRSDDGIGQQIAQSVAAWGMPNVQTIAIHQLTPELAETLETFDIVIFVDAYPISDYQDIQIKLINSSQFNPIMGHTGDPRSLLALAQALYNRVPQTWWVIVPGVNFEVGDRLSSIAEHHIEIALQKIDHLIQTVRTEPCTKSE
ncbi:MAG: hydrogenase maturation protease [Cyanobacteria bacterium CRU_2_1]|nr:hydrogenase maturation protease [Cyanobacteria bacterium CRU_2_1]